MQQTFRPLLSMFSGPMRSQPPEGITDGPTPELELDPFWKFQHIFFSEVLDLLKHRVVHFGPQWIPVADFQLQPKTGESGWSPPSHSGHPSNVAGSMLRGICRNIVLLYDGEVCFDCAGSRKMRPASLAVSILHGSYRNIMMLYDVEVRFGNTARDLCWTNMLFGLLVR